jgi:K+-transporting ATPase c subunit
LIVFSVVTGLKFLGEPRLNVLMLKLALDGR